MIQILLTIASSLLLLLAQFTRPTTARTPEGWYVNGIRPDGRYEVRMAPILREKKCSPSCVNPDEPDLHYRSRIYCTGGSRPIVINHRRVGCSR